MKNQVSPKAHSLMDSIFFSLDPSYVPKTIENPIPPVVSQSKSDMWKVKMDEVQVLIDRANSVNETIVGSGCKKTLRQVHKALIETTDIFHRREELFKIVRSQPSSIERRKTLEMLYKLRDIDDGSMMGSAVNSLHEESVSLNWETLKVLLLEKYHDQLAEERARKELDFHNLMLAAYLATRNMVLNGVGQNAPTKMRAKPASKAKVRFAPSAPFRTK